MLWNKQKASFRNMNEWSKEASLRQELSRLRPNEATAGTSGRKEFQAEGTEGAKAPRWKQT